MNEARERERHTHTKRVERWRNIGEGRSLDGWMDGWMDGDMVEQD